MISSVESQRVEVAAACWRHGVERLDLFGSAAGGTFDPDSSDLDFIVAFQRREPPDLFDRYFGLKEDLETLFGRSVDLVMEGALRKEPCFVEDVQKSCVPLYAAWADAENLRADKGLGLLRPGRA
jgi:predicted nucleotidyltransferase